MIRAGGLRGYQSLVRQLGGDPAPLLRRHRLTPEMLQDEDALIPLRAQAQLLEATADTLSCPDFGLRLAAMQDISILGPLAVAIQHSPTVAEALRCASRYLFVHSPALSFSVFPERPGAQNMAELRFEVLSPELPASRQGADLALGVIHRMMLLIGRGHYRLRGVTLPHAPLAEPAAYQRFFGAPVHFAQPFAALVITPITLDTPLGAVNDTLRQLASDYLDAHFPQPERTVASRVRLAVARSLAGGQARKSRIAVMLAMHPRTLQRRLHEEGTSFETIRDTVCRETAWRSIRDTRLPLSQVAGLVGFSEQAALTRACRRWFGATPSALRRHPESSAQAAAARAAAAEPSR